MCVRVARVECTCKWVHQVSIKIAGRTLAQMGKSTGEDGKWGQGLLVLNDVTLLKPRHKQHFPEAIQSDIDIGRRRKGETKLQLAKAGFSKDTFLCQR